MGDEEQRNLAEARAEEDAPAREDRLPNGQFAPGHHYALGKPRGSRNKLGEAFLKDVHEHWVEHGAAALKKICEERPYDYVRMVAGILPKEIKMQVNELDELTDVQLGIQLTAILGELAELGMDYRPNAEAAGEPEPPRQLPALSQAG
jgi:hypothetical protein